MTGGLSNDTPSYSGSVGVYSFIYFKPVPKSGAIAFCNLPLDDFGKVRDLVHGYKR